MVDCLIGTKLGMTQVFKPNGKPVAVTAIEAGPCVVTQVKTSAKEGYNAVQLGFSTAKRLNAAEKGHLKDLGMLKHLREFRVADSPDAKIGDKVDVNILKAGDQVTVTGISKGKGFAGVVKRHHFRGGPKTHGQSDRQRAPGAIGSTTFPGRVYKGLRMAGHLGNARVTSRNLDVIQVDASRNLILLHGSAPGAPGEMITIRKVAPKR
ncbi:MAG: 50S ribosomal protein L3 [Chloroflexota bacterium]